MVGGGRPSRMARGVASDGSGQVVSASGHGGRHAGGWGDDEGLKKSEKRREVEEEKKTNFAVECKCTAEEADLACFEASSDLCS